MDLDLTNLGAAMVGAVVGLVTSYVALRRDHREQRVLAISEAKDTIALLREQTDLFKEHGESREQEWRALELGWRQREERLEARISDLERDYRQLVLTVTSMGLCASAPACPNYNPGDRRRPAPALPTAGPAEPPG